MGFLDALKGVFGGSGGGAGAAGAAFFIYVRCRRGHPIRLWVNRGYDLVRTFASMDEHEGYLLRKSIVFLQGLHYTGGATELCITIFAHGDFRIDLLPEEAALLGRLGVAMTIEIKPYPTTASKTSPTQ